MIWLLVSIICNTLLLLILKSFDRFRVNTLQGIVVNYLMAGSLALYLTRSQPAEAHASWHWIPFVLGSLFISIFFLIARTAQTIGVSVATVANKMSVVIPVVLAILLYHDPVTFWKIAGMVLALLAVWLTTKTTEKQASGNAKNWLFPVLIFFGSGIIDALINYAQQEAVPAEQSVRFIAYSFFSAFVIGVVILSIQLVRGTNQLTIRSIVGGICLGIPNYFSIYALMRALQAGVFDSSTLYPINNMGIVALSAIGAFILFREKLNAWNIAGILLAIGAIALMTFC
ncbi:MAG: EamA/RhaT family transporter [Bacteroidia bacterium]